MNPDRQKGSAGARSLVVFLAPGAFGPPAAGPGRAGPRGAFDAPPSRLRPGPVGGNSGGGGAPARERRRLRHLYEVSKLLLRFDSTEQTLPSIFAIMMQTLSLRSVVLLCETGGLLHSHTWQASGASTIGLRLAEMHARRCYAYLAGAGAAPSAQGIAPLTSVALLPAAPAGAPAASGERQDAESWVALPLVVDRGRVFGSLQLVLEGDFEEAGLLFVNAIVNQLAIALDRQSARQAERAWAEEQRRTLEGRWVASEVARGQAERARALAEALRDEHQARLDVNRAVTNSLGEGVVALERSENAQHFLADASASLGASLDYEQTVTTVMRLAIPSLADVCCLDLLADGGDSARAEVAFASDEHHVIAPLQRLLLESAWRKALTTVREGGQALLWPALDGPPPEGGAPGEGLAERPRGPDSASLMALPLRARGHLLGLLALGSLGSGRRYSTADLAFAEELAHRASTAIDNARLHRQTERAVRQRQDVLAVVSHDLRTPLGTIMLGVTLLAEEPDGDDQSGTRLKTIATLTRAVAQMDRLLKDLLDMSSIDAGHLSLDRQPYALGPLMEDAFEPLRPLTARKRLRFETRTGSPEVMLTCDRWRVVQVLSNLVGNAIKFSPEGGAIELLAEPRERDVRFAVTDGGPGIASDRLPHVFERYWQATETAFKGTGLGLYICKGIVEAHGGTMGVESQPGRGSTFFFTLPLCPPPADETSVSAEPIEDEEPAPRSTERPAPPPSLVWPPPSSRR